MVIQNATAQCLVARSSRAQVYNAPHASFGPIGPSVGRLQKACGAVVAALFAAAAMASMTAPASANGDITGTWIDDTGKGAVEISPCGNTVCGRIVWLKDPKTKAGEPLTDQLNPRASSRRRPICGLQVIGKLKPQADGSWDEGWIYDPKQGKSFDVEIKRVNESRLRVTGYLGVKFLSETFIWTKAPPSIDRCKA